jgi:hypothetical protein
MQRVWQNGSRLSIAAQLRAMALKRVVTGLVKKHVVCLYLLAGSVGGQPPAFA